MLQISLHTQITTMILWTWWRMLHDTTSLGGAKRSTSLVCQMSPQTYWNSTMRSTTKTHSLSLLSSSETPYWVKSAMKDVRSGDMVENTNLTMWTPKKAWATIRRLGADNVSPPVVTTVTADQIANQLLSNGRRNNQPPTELTKPFSLDELATVLSLLKPGKAAGLDGLLTEMLQHLGNKAKTWLLDMLNECTRTKHIPSIWWKGKVITISKPGKNPSSPKSYRPILLLCIPYKLYERLILMRISPLVDEKLTKDQAGFRPGPSCAGQLLNLTKHIEDGYERKMLTGADSSICRPVSCIRHSSTTTNDKKADGHDWRHRSMPGDSRPSQQSPLLCTAKWQEEPMKEPEEQTACRKEVS